jgi:Tfp pilus assembly protein PilX
MSRLRNDQSGFALVVVLALLLAMFSLGLALVARATSESTESRFERTRESSFNVAEAALSAQVTQLSRSWPTDSTAPTSCTPASTGSACPQASAVSGAYTAKDYSSTCPTSPTTPAWQTYVRDNAPNEQYWTTAVSSRAAYDGGSYAADSFLWVRSTGFVQCHKVSMVALVSRSVQAMNFPNSVLTANWLQTSNQGKKVIIDTLGAYAQPPSIRPSSPAAQPGSVVVRCSGLTTAQCLNYSSSQGQIQPPAARTDSTVPTTALSLSQLQSLERQAQAAGTLWASGNCPTTSSNLSSVNGAPVVIVGSCDVVIQGSTVVNSSTSPGVLVIETGTLTMSGNATFYGLLYMLNKQNADYPTPVLTIQGNATIQGVIAVDGRGGVKAGASKTNIIYDPRAAGLLRGESGASASKNSFRLLPAKTP